MRTAEIKRKTNETDIILTLNLDGTGKSEINSGNGFMDHMLTLFAKHGRFDLAVNCNGDTQVDFHHSAEDIGICLGKAFKQALGDMKGIYRYGDIILPMDETLILCTADLLNGKIEDENVILCATDISGRSYLGLDLPLPSSRVGDFDTELVEEFLIAFVNNANITLHIKELAGKNTHHIIEGTFKALGRTLSKAVKINPETSGESPSTKGVL
ncbi:MAG: imidazoleglycerol-phosphate dehydratase [Acutalibacteraceae bacterium]|nr:imidazoleglycerol-phosphate dehydratase [Acutalibacteraceae bacterium]